MHELTVIYIRSTPSVGIVQHFGSFLLHPREGCKVLWWVRLLVCLSARITRKPHGRTSQFLLCLLPVVVLLGPPMAGSFMIRHVLPVLWMALYFHITAGTGPGPITLHDMCIPRTRQAWQPRFQPNFASKYSLRVAHRGRSVLSTIALLCLCWVFFVMCW